MVSDRITAGIITSYLIIQNKDIFRQSKMTTKLFFPQRKYHHSFKKKKSIFKNEFASFKLSFRSFPSAIEPHWIVGNHKQWRKGYLTDQMKQSHQTYMQNIDLEMHCCLCTANSLQRQHLIYFRQSHHDINIKESELNCLSYRWYATKHLNLFGCISWLNHPNPGVLKFLNTAYISTLNLKNLNWLLYRYSLLNYTKT